MANQVSLATLSLEASAKVVSHGLGDGATITRSQRTVQQVLEDSSKIINTPGVHIIYMPKIEDYFDVKKNPTVAKQLADSFRMPPWFFESMGWDANGFYASHTNPLQDPEHESYSIFSRFLTKHVYSEGDKRRARDDPDRPKINSLSIDYEWSYMAFFALWRSARNSKPDLGNDDGDDNGDNDDQLPMINNNSLVLLCFDLSEDVVSDLDHVLAGIDANSCLSNPFMIFGKVCEAVTREIDDALWGLQPFVRYVEKHRSDFAEEFTVDLAKLNERYAGIHELIRHTLHISETLKVAARTLQTLLKDSQTFSASHPSQLQPPLVPLLASQTVKDIELWSVLMANFRERAQAFADRLKNEAQLSSNIAAAYDAKVLAFLQQSRAEGQSLTDTVALLTLIFLPGTFVSGFFGMNFFNLASTSDRSAWVFTGKLWIYFATTVPLTLLSLFLFTLDLNLIVWIKKHITSPLERRVRGTDTTQITKSLARQSTRFRKGNDQSGSGDNEPNGATPGK